MSAVELIPESDDFLAEISAPVSFDLISSLVGQYQHQKKEIETVAEFMAAPKNAGTLRYFLDGNEVTGSLGSTFSLSGAINSLNSDFWGRALALTDILESMPAEQRHAWYDQIKGNSCPDFEEGTVRSTLATLAAQRTQFVADRVDAIFRALSPDHKTNLPFGFSKRFIIAGMLDSYGYVDNRKADYISDLRQIIAKLTKREVKPHSRTNGVLSIIAARYPGRWVDIDGWALRVKLYKHAGTAHLEVHPDIAWRLNELLSTKYPQHIPSEIRKPSVRKVGSKPIQMLQRPLPFEVLNALSEARPSRKGGENLYWLPSAVDKFTAQEAGRVLAAIGGVFQKGGFYQFGYDPSSALDHIMLTGCIPEHRSHQYYPTPPSIAVQAVEFAEIEPWHSVLEPSAGQGGLADHIPAEMTTCVEISELHAKVLQAKGFANVINADFIEWAVSAPKFDRVVMNPPFSDGRAEHHLAVAASLLKPGGVLVAILPASFKTRDVLPGMQLEWGPIICNEFAGTSVSIVILKVTR